MPFRNYDMVSVDAQTALTAYVAAFVDALVGQPKPWAQGLGLFRSGKLPIKTKWPISLSTAGYQPQEGDSRFRTLADEFVEVVSENWQDGIAELARVVEAPDFFGWGEEPQNMAKAANALLNKIVATLLAGGKTADCWDGKKFFATNHPVNKFAKGGATFLNLSTTKPVGVSSLEFMKQHFRSLKAADGSSLGLELGTILSPGALDEPWKDVLERDLIVEAVAGTDTDAATVSNRHKGTVDLTVGNELTEDDVYYGIAKGGTVKPWGLQKGDVENLILDKESALYEREKKVGIDSTCEANGALLFPHAIIRMETT